MKKVSRTQLAKAFVGLVNQSNLNKLIQELARELVVSRRSSEVDLLVRDINRELLRQKGHLEAKVITAHSLSAELKRRVETSLARQTGAKTVHTVAYEQPGLIGGLMAETPDELIDLSLKSKLEQLEV